MSEPGSINGRLAAAETEIARLTLDAERLSESGRRLLDSIPRLIAAIATAVDELDLDTADIDATTQRLSGLDSLEVLADQIDLETLTILARRRT